MGIFGALNTAVAGLRAQSFALENISGNIANSQTTGFKRFDTSFRDLVGSGENIASKQTAGLVQASTRGTNNVQGAIEASDRNTFLAINGDGYFIVKEATNVVDGNTVFSGNDLYTRRGDFELDKDGHLVNGSGYYLSGYAVDPNTGNLTGNVPDVIQIDGDFLESSRTSEIDYRANLPSYPLSANADPTDPNSELLDISLYGTGTASFTPTITPPPTATDNGIAVITAADIATLTDGDQITITDGSVGAQTFTYNSTSDGLDGATFGSVDTLVTALGAAANPVTATLAGTDVQVTSTNLNETITPALATDDPGPGRQYGAPDTITANNETTFLNSSIAGGAITIFDDNGSPLDVQIRWAKTQNAGISGATNDTYEMYYLNNSNASGASTKWTRVGAGTAHNGYQFNSSGQMTEINDESLDVTLDLAGSSIAVTFRHGPGGLTQYDDPNGTTALTSLAQDGYPAGDLIDVSINDGGRVVASYSNGQTRDLAEIALADFNADNELRRVDGGAYLQTSASGEPLFTAPTNVVAASLEASNTDIADEFSKLIITQQAYTANTRTLSAADEMLQEAVNIVR